MSSAPGNFDGPHTHLVIAHDGPHTNIQIRHGGSFHTAILKEGETHTSAIPATDPPKKLQAEVKDGKVHLHLSN